MMKILRPGTNARLISIERWFSTLQNRLQLEFLLRIIRQASEETSFRPGLLFERQEGFPIT